MNVVMVHGPWVTSPNRCLRFARVEKMMAASYRSAEEVLSVQQKQTVFNRTRVLP